MLLCGTNYIVDVGGGGALERYINKKGVLSIALKKTHKQKKKKIKK